MRSTWQYESVIGPLFIVEEDGALLRVSFVSMPDPAAETRKSPLITETIAQLEEYFQQKRRVFSLPLDPCGTVFQKKVWQALQEIPYGETMSYGQIARMVDSPKAFRAVGMANHCNPIVIIVPCHRVIGADGSMVGYGAGLGKKEFLLRLEGALF